MKRERQIDDDAGREEEGEIESEKERDYTYDGEETTAD
jgi:hypothetical protein